MADVRADWHEYFMRIAQVVATRSTCDRRHVGAVIVRDRTILSTGYNGSVRGLAHCDDVGHMIEGDHCVATIHAEQNAIIQAAKNGVRIEDAEIYTTASPCWNCFKMIANAGLRRIYYASFYREERIFRVAKLLGLELIDLSPVGDGTKPAAPSAGDSAAPAGAPSAADGDQGRAGSGR